MLQLSSHHRRRPLFSRIDRRWVIDAAKRKFHKRAPCGPARAVPRLLASYLCGGGCHAEVLSAGRSGCDYIRGWLEYCLEFYDRLLQEMVLRERPDLLGWEVI